LSRSLPFTVGDLVPGRFLSTLSCLTIGQGTFTNSPWPRNWTTWLPRKPLLYSVSAPLCARGDVAHFRFTPWRVTTTFRRKDFLILFVFKLMEVHQSPDVNSSAPPPCFNPNFSPRKNGKGPENFKYSDWFLPLPPRQFCGSPVLVHRRRGAPGTGKALPFSALLFTQYSPYAFHHQSPLFGAVISCFPIKSPLQNDVYVIPLPTRSPRGFETQASSS